MYSSFSLLAEMLAIPNIAIPIVAISLFFIMGNILKGKRIDKTSILF